MRLTSLAPEAKGKFSAQTLANCQHRINAEWGLHFPPERWTDLERHLRLVAAELGVSAEDCASTLQKPSLATPVAARWVQELTVGETYFLRDPDFFERLAQAVMIPLIAQRRARQQFHLRLWSAGCCTGEEAYTLAILVRSLLPDAEAWQIRILASDLNSAFLAKARRGSYGKWSFRQVDGRWQARHFERESDGCWRIRQEYRDDVVFLEHNLVETHYPDPGIGLADCDVILCRNVLMYFSPAQAVAALARLRATLSADGVLLLASAEGMLCQWAGLVPDIWPGALCLNRKARTPERDASALTPRSTSIPPAAGHREAVAPMAPSAPLVPVATLRQEAASAAATARECANQHRLAEAFGWIEHALALDRLEPGFYWLLASLHIEQAEPERAIAALRKALYLDPDFVMAHYLCGLLSLGRDDPASAIRDLRNCLRLLEPLDHASPLPEADGLTAMDLKVLVQNSLKQLTL